MKHIAKLKNVLSILIGTGRLPGYPGHSERINIPAIPQLKTVSKQLRPRVSRRVPHYYENENRQILRISSDRI